MRPVFDVPLIFLFCFSVCFELALLLSWRGQVAPPTPFCTLILIARFFSLLFSSCFFFPFPFYWSRVHFGRGGSVFWFYDLVRRRRPLFLANIHNLKLPQPDNPHTNPPSAFDSCPFENRPAQSLGSQTTPHNLANEKPEIFRVRCPQCLSALGNTV